jgi:two-component system LytT family response regulator
MRQTLSGLVQRLGAEFARCHRRYLVRIDQIVESRVLPKGDAELVLHSGAQVPCSRQYREDLQQRLG